MDLFLQPQSVFEKTAGKKMPEDPNAWPQEVLQQLFKEIPYMSEFSPHVTMDKADGEKGYGFGYVTVMNQTETQMGTDPQAQQAAGLRQVRIPIVIKDGELFPLDLLVTDDSKVQPLTESRLRAAIFRPQAFDVTSKTPGDQSMIGQLYPPYRQNYGFGGGGVAMNVGMGKEGSALEEFLEKEAGIFSRATQRAGEEAAKGGAKVVGDFAKKHKSELAAGAGAAATGKYQYDKMRDRRVAKNTVEELRKQSMVEAIQPTLNESDIVAFKEALRDPNVRMAFEKNAGASYGPVSVLLTHETAKLASLPGLVKPTVMQLINAGGDYLLKTASHKYWAPTTERLTRPEVFQKLGSLASKVVLAADSSGSATIADEEAVGEPEAEPDSDMEGMGPVTEFGMYKVLSDEGQELIGYVIPNLVDIDGVQSPISLFANGSNAAIQGDILGVPIEGEATELPSGDMPGGFGLFYTADQEIMATVPMNLQGSFEMGGEPGVYQAETYDGRPVEVSQQPNIQTVVAVDGRMLVPAHWQWLPLSNVEAVSLASSEQEMPKEGSAQQAFATVDVVSGGETFSIRGYAVEKLAAADREFLGTDEALFLLAGLGVSPEYGIKKMGEATAGREPVQVRIGNYIKLAEERVKEARASALSWMKDLPPLRQNLFKEAAFITDPEAVDTVLSLGFINPENIQTFIAYLPKIDETQECLCNLLFASRLGLSDIPESALETAVRGTEEVLEGLKTIAFQGPALHS